MQCRDAAVIQENKKNPMHWAFPPILEALPPPTHLPPTSQTGVEKMQKNPPMLSIS